MLSAGRARRRAVARRPVPRRRDHRVDCLRGRARRPAAPRAHRRGPARHGQHARRTDDAADAGALGVHRRAQDAGALGRAARARLHPRPLRRVRSERRLRRTRVRRPARTRPPDRRARIRGLEQRGGGLDPPRRDPRPHCCEAAREARGLLDRDARGRRHLDRSRARLPGARRRPADRTQRHLHRVRPPHRGAREDAGLPVPVLEDAARSSTAVPRSRASTPARCSPRPGFDDERIEALLAGGAAAEPARAVAMEA